MRIAYTDEQIALRDTLRAYFAANVTQDIHDEMAAGEMGGPKSQDFVRKMGADGWLGLGWPKEYGGHGMGPIEQFVFYDEAQRAGAPVPFLTINTVGPSIQKYGTEKMKNEILPKILKGEIFFSIGYTEPAAGTDLAGLQTRAVRDGDEFVINGQKIFTSLIDHADYVWLACRTNPDAERHAGISIILVPTSAEGFSWTPIHTVGGASTSSTYYQDVRVPVENVVGEIDGGWEVIVNQLNYERISLSAPGTIERPYTDVLRWAQDTKLADGRRVIDQEWVQIHLARVHAKIEALRLINWKSLWATTIGAVSPADSSATKVYGTNFYCEAYSLLLEVLGSAGILQKDSPGAVLAGKIERSYRGVIILTFGGGVNEVQRDLIAMFGLKMPRPLR